MISSRKLTYFVAVAEEQNFGRAAARLGITQPPLSKQIQELERELRIKLFVRTTRSVELTREGQALLTHARKIIQDLRMCHTIVRDKFRESQANINLGVLHAHTYSFLPALLRSYFLLEPDINVLLHEYSTNEQVSRLLGDTIDIGIVREPISHPGIIVENLFQEDYILAVPAVWLREEITHTSIKNFEKRNMISYPSHDSLRGTSRLFQDYLEQHGVAIDKQIEVKTVHSALALVASGRGFSPVPRSQSTLQFPYVRYVDMAEPPPTLAVGIAWRDQFLSEHIRRFIRISRRFFASK